MSRIRRFLARLDRLPKAPFIAAVAAASVLAAAAWATAPDGESNVDEAEELYHPSVSDPPTGVVPRQAPEAELIEYGFGALTVDGEERFGVGAVVRNPHPDLAVNVLMEAEAFDLQGEPVAVERFRIAMFAPDSELLIGRLLKGDAAEWEARRFELSVSEVSYQVDFQIPPDHAEIQFSLLEVEETVEPEGQRLVYQVESDLDYKYLGRISVVFRDPSGQIVGGLSSGARPEIGLEAGGPAGIPPGASVRYFYLGSGQIPEGADLSRTQLGPSSLDLGG